MLLSNPVSSRSRMKKPVKQGVLGRIALAMLFVISAAGSVAAGPSSVGLPTHRLQGHVPPATQRLAPISRLPPEEHLNLAFGLSLHNQDLLTNLLQRIYDPQSPDYRHFLTTQQFIQRFCPPEAEYQSVMDFALSNNLTVTATHTNRLLLEVNARVADIERAFQIQLHRYPHPKENRTFYAPNAEPGVEAGLAIQDISGLDNYSLPHPTSLHTGTSFRAAKPLSGSGVGGTYRGGDFRAAYAPGVTLTGAGQSVGLLEFDGYYSSDISSYENQAGLPAVPLQNVLVNRFKGNPGPNNNEVALDIEVTVAMAPGLSKVLVYEGSLPNSILNQMALDNAAKQLSSSWSYTINATTEAIYLQFAAQGQTMLQASGDNDAYSGVVDTPCDDPNLTIVGGTTLTTSGPGGNWISETTWNWANSGTGNNGTGGGISTVYPLPAWQRGIHTLSNQASTTMRNLPDVAMTADNIMVIYDNGSTGAFGGTSAAAPLWAGFMALVNQQATIAGKPVVGFLNPLLYTVAQGTGYGSAFHDIITGNNTNAASPTRFWAVTGYDSCTGWGTPAGQPLLNALSGSSNPLPPTVAHLQMSPTANLLTLNWTGGKPPYQVQMASDLVFTNWATLATTTNQNLSIRTTNASAFFRVLGQ